MLRIVSTVKNVGDKNLKVVKLGTVLDNERYTRSFIVTKDGKQVPFTGVEVCAYSPLRPPDLLRCRLIIAHNRGSHRSLFPRMTSQRMTGWSSLPAGTRLPSTMVSSMLEAVSATSVEQNPFTVSALYDFSATGPGTFTFDPVSSFQVVGLDDTDKATSDPVRINVKNAHPVSITVTDDVSKRELDLKKRWIADCPAVDHQLGLITSSLNSKELAQAAIWLLERNGTDNQDYISYFGTPDSFGLVYTNFANIVNNVLDLPLKCAGNNNNACGSRGPVFVSDGSLVYCDNFFSDTYNPTSSLQKGDPLNITHNRGALAFRELTHLLLHTETYGYGCADSKGLSDPLKIQNADNYVVSTQVARGLPGAHVLTWGHDLCSASLP